MSTALGLAATVAVLRQLLESGFADLKIGDVLGGTLPAVTCLAPDQIDVKSATSQLNLFVYHHTRNAGWFNDDQPSRDARGERVASPALAFDVFVLVTAYGAAPFHAEVMLGAAMQILHETPGLGRDAIRAALTPGPSRPDLPEELQSSGLADQIEQLRISPLNQSLDDLSRIWSAIQLPLRPSAAYQVGVLLIRAVRSQRVPLPVAARAVYVMPLRQPRIDRIEHADGPRLPIDHTSRLRLFGADLRAPSLRLLINGLDVSAAITSAGNDTIECGLQIPALPNPPAPPPGLRAGVSTVQVVHPQMMGEPPVDRAATASNIAAFVLNPAATFVVAAGATSSVVDGVTLKSGEIRVQCVPGVGSRQRVRLLLNEKAPPDGRPPRAYSFDSPDGNGIVAPATETGTLSIAYRMVAAGAYLARLQVDAGISHLQFVAGQMAQPEVLL